MKKNATVYTVAERALAGSPKVAPHTRQRVLQAVEELHSVADPAARRLAYKHTDTIALVFSDISGPYYRVGQAAWHLLHGHQRFAIVTGPLNSLDNWERLEGGPAHPGRDRLF